MEKFVSADQQSLDAYFARYPWAKAASERAVAKVAKGNKPASASGWKRNYHPANAAMIAGVGGDVKNTRGVAIAGKKKAKAGK